MIRWHATIIYRTDAGPVDVEHDMSELEEIHDLVERGPHWDCIERVVIRRSTISTLTIEKALTL